MKKCVFFKEVVSLSFPPSHTAVHVQTCLDNINNYVFACNTLQKEMLKNMKISCDISQYLDCQFTKNTLPHGISWFTFWNKPSSTQERDGRLFLPITGMYHGNVTAINHNNGWISCLKASVTRQMKSNKTTERSAFIFRRWLWIKKIV